MYLLGFGVVTTVIGTILVSEAKSWMPYLSRWLVRSVLDRFPEELPKEHRDRWREEIEADLESYADRPLGGLWFAIGVRRRGARRLVAELVLQLALAKPNSGPVEQEEASEPAVAKERLRLKWVYGGPRLMGPGFIRPTSGYYTLERRPVDSPEAPESEPEEGERE